MTRDLRRLADTRFDVVVVGAGFYGAAAAWDATLRGLSVAVIDKGDFGAATSFNNLKTLHGGLRSLQSLDLPQMRRFIRERRALARVAPHLVQPLSFVVPTYRHPLRSTTAMRLALAANEVVSADRHAGIDDPALRLPAGSIVSRAECLRRNPLIDDRGVTGGAVWHDYQMHNADRMTLAFLLSAAERGAVAVNYLRATRFLEDGGRIAGVQAQDALGGQSLNIRARMILNAAGPWAASLLRLLNRPVAAPAPALSRAMNLVVRQVPVTQACGGRARGRFLFVVPWRDVSIVGTSHDPYDGSADALSIGGPDVARFVKEVAEAFPQAGLTSSDVRLVHRGLLPTLTGQRSDHGVRLLRESTVVNHRRDGAPGMISMFGVRYTTARDTAARAIDAVFRDRGVTTPPLSRSHDTPVVGGDIPHKQRFLDDAVGSAPADIGADTTRRLALTYGSRHTLLLQLMRDEPKLARPLGATCAVTGAEVLHAVRQEAAVRLTDALIRRTEAGSAGHPGGDAVRAAAALMSDELAWQPARVAEEIEAVEEFYSLSTA